MAARFSGAKAGTGRLSTQKITFVLFCAAMATVPIFASEYWLKGILIPTMIFGLAALGLNLMSGYAGLLSLGQAAFMAVGAFIGVIAYGRYGIPLPLSLVLAGAAAALIGLVVGTPSLRIKGLYVLAATLAAQFIILWAIQRIPWMGGGSFVSIVAPPISLAGWGVTSSKDQYFLTLIVVSLLTLFAWNLSRTRVGRAWVAIRDHDVSAAVMGISMLRYKLFAFMISSFYAGVAGALVVFCWVGAANLQDYELEVSIKLLGMIIIGGLGSILGSFLGAAFVSLLPVLISVALLELTKLLGHSSVTADLLANAEHIVFGSLILFFLTKEPEGLARLGQRFAWWLDAILGLLRRRLSTTSWGKK